MSEEKVLCFPRTRLEELGVFEGVSLNVNRYFCGIMASPLTYVPRSQAEGNPDWKQIIPYVMVVHSESDSILSYRRGKRGAESRLHGRRSVGIGGHINPGGCYNENLSRELQEELGIGQFKDFPVAVMNEDINPTGKDHFAMIHVFEVDTLDVIARCSSIVEPQFMPIETARAIESEYEQWSVYCLRNYGGIMEAYGDI